MSIFCKHKWQVLDKTIEPSDFEVATQAIKNMGAEAKVIPHQMCNTERKVIHICACVNCGKIKKFVEEI